MVSGVTRRWFRVDVRMHVCSGDAEVFWNQPPLDPGRYLNPIFMSS